MPLKKVRSWIPSATNCVCIHAQETMECLAAARTVSIEAQDARNTIECLRRPRPETKGHTSNSNGPSQRASQRGFAFLFGSLNCFRGSFFWNKYLQTPLTFIGDECHKTHRNVTSAIYLDPIRVLATHCPKTVSRHTNGYFLGRAAKSVRFWKCHPLWSTMVGGTLIDSLE
jgi:hypothetical protein